jgi:hypothetical protein
MKVIFTLEASQPCGNKFRIAVGCILPQSLVMMVTLFLRLI